MRFTTPKWLLFACFVAFLWSLYAAGQQVTRKSAPQTPAHTGDLDNAPADADDARARLAHEMEKKAAKERVAALKKDTDKLLKLSVELKSYVDKSDENVMSLEVIKKAEEIEKLAKSVRDKMKGPN